MAEFNSDDHFITTVGKNPLEEMGDHSVVFEIASKYCISDSFVDYNNYSISSKGLLTQ